MKQTQETLKNKLPEVRKILNAALPNANHLSDEELMKLIKQAYVEMELKPNEQFYPILHNLITTDKIIRRSHAAQVDEKEKALNFSSAFHSLHLYQVRIAEF